MNFYEIILDGLIGRRITVELATLDGKERVKATGIHRGEYLQCDDGTVYPYRTHKVARFL